jgi:hypothetical protein
MPVPTSAFWGVFLKRCWSVSARTCGGSEFHVVGTPLKLHLFALLWIYCATSCTGNPQQFQKSPRQISNKSNELSLSYRPVYNMLYYKSTTFGMSYILLYNKSAANPQQIEQVESELCALHKVSNRFPGTCSALDGAYCILDVCRVLSCRRHLQDIVLIILPGTKIYFHYCSVGFSTQKINFRSYDYWGHRISTIINIIYRQKSPYKLFRILAAVAISWYRVRIYNVLNCRSSPTRVQMELFIFWHSSCTCLMKASSCT